MAVIRKFRKTQQTTLQDSLKFIFKLIILCCNLIRSSISGLFWLVTRSEDRQQKPVKLKGWQSHNRIIQRTSDHIKHWQRTKKPGSFMSVLKKSSVIGRATDYKNKSFKIDVSELNDIIEIRSRMLNF